MVFSNIIKHNGNHYYVDSRWTIDHGYETMAFPCDANGNVTNWRGVYRRNYATATQMELGHKNAIESLKQGRFYTD